MKIQEIHFNHDPDRGGTISLSKGPGIGRDGPRTAITAPEWLDGVSQPVAYARGALTGPITIKVRFTKGPRNERVKIRAVGPLEPRLRPTGPSRMTTVLGEVKPRIVGFDASGESGLQTFELSDQMQMARVGRVDVTWNWQVQVAGDVWQDLLTTNHLIYITILLPTKPWKKATMEVMHTPWAEALELGTLWAHNAPTVAESTANIANAIYSLVNQDYLADSVYVDSPDAPFNLTQFLYDVHKSGSFTNECRGIAAALVTFANLMGDHLCPLMMRPSVGNHIDTHPIRLIGPEPNPFQEVFFGRHEVATMQGTPTDDLSPVYDACLQLAGQPPNLPVDMPLGHIDPNGVDYRFRLIASGDLDVLTVIPPRAVI